MARKQPWTTRTAIVQWGPRLEDKDLCRLVGRYENEYGYVYQGYRVDKPGRFECMEENIIEYVD